MNIMTKPIYLLSSLSLFCISPCTSFNAIAQSGSSDPDFEGNSGAVIVNGLRVIKRQDLDFGVIAPSISQPSTVRTNRGANNSSVCGSHLTCLKPGNRARFTIIGEPNRYVLISDPGSILLFNESGDQMLVDTFSGAGSSNDTQWRGSAVLRNSGISRFNVGATLHVGSNQPRGQYIGSFVLNVDYQ